MLRQYPTCQTDANMKFELITCEKNMKRKTLESFDVNIFVPFPFFVKEFFFNEKKKRSCFKILLKETLKIHFSQFNETFEFFCFLSSYSAVICALKQFQYPHRAFFRTVLI